MRMRWMLAASILVLLVALVPGALRAAEEPGCAPAVTAAVSFTANAAVNESSPALTALPFWNPALSSSPQPSRGIDEPPSFLCSSCPPQPRCSSLHNCWLAGCCH